MAAAAVAVPASEAPALYPTLRLQRLGSIAVIQPLWRGDVAGPSLTCDLETGSLALAEHPLVEQRYTPLYGVLGLERLDAGPALVVITGVEEVGTLRGHPVYRVTKTEVLADSRNSKWKPDDHMYLDLLRAGTSPQRHGGSLYLSYGGDATLSQQRWEAARGDPKYAVQQPWQRAEPAFFWNRALAQPLLEAGMGKFVPPVFMGFVGQLSGLQFKGPVRTYDATITLIARRSVRRIGCRQWRRGTDLEANAANWVESEQLVVLDGSSIVASFLQVRGSVPLLWSQAPTLKYKIPIRIAPPSRQDAVFQAHVRGVLEGYKECVGINLANQTGREGKLSAAYKEASDRFASTSSGFRLVPFDFHKQCGASNYARLSLLWDEIAPDFARFGYYFKDGTGTHDRQGGVFRTNCIDCLDRTNVVQGQLGKRQLEQLLERLGVMPLGSSLAQAFPEVEVAFRVMWADHGDEVSQQYAGTGAMKSSFTRTGKRDIWGLLDDGAKSLTRYYLNNFEDGHKQDALDLATGNYRVAPGKPAKFQPRGSPAMPLLLIAVVVAFALRNAAALAAGPGLLADPSALLQQVLFLLALAAAVAWVMSKNGKRLVDAPQLRADLVHPWGPTT